MLLTLAALDALRGKGRLPGQADCLGKLEPALGFAFHIHGVPAAEDAGNIHAAGAGHAVAAAGAADFLVRENGFLNLFQDGEVTFRHRAGDGFISDPTVFFHHGPGIHAGKDNRYFRLVIQPAQAPLRRAPSTAAVRHGCLCLARQHIHKLPAAQRFHDHDRDAFGIRCLQALAAGLADLVQIVVLDLAHIPVIIVEDLQEVLGIAVIGETDVPDGTGGFLLPDPVNNPGVLESFPHGDIRQVVHQVVVDMVGAQPAQFLREVFFDGGFCADEVLGQLGSDIYLVPQPVALQNLTQSRFRAAVYIGRIKVVDPGIVRCQDFLLGFGNIDACAFFGKPHAAVAEYGQRGAVFIISVLHKQFS